MNYTKVWGAVKGLTDFTVELCQSESFFKKIAQIR